MKEHPILFSSKMVKAILEGRKTQTRRVIKHGKYFITQCKSYKQHPGGGWWGTDGVLDAPGCDIWFTCPYGEPGHHLWVKESFVANYFDDGKPGYKADWTNVAAEYVTEPKWTPSIHMPRTASRITLEVVNIRVERVQEITDTEGMREGWVCDPNNLDYLPRQWFGDLWDSINAKRGYGWDSNPWVWVVEFKRI